MLKPNEILNLLSDAARRKMEPEKLEALYGNLLTMANGDWTEEWAQKVLGVITGVTRSTRDIEAEIRQQVEQWVSMQDGVFTIEGACRDLAIVRPRERSIARNAVMGMIERGLLEKEGAQSGKYRKIATGAQEQQWWVATGEPLHVRFPLGITQPRIFPGNIILLEGAKSQGKTRFAIEFSRLNHMLWPEKRVCYLNAEMGDDEILSRAQAYENVRDANMRWTPEEFRRRIEVKSVTSLWHDHIDPNGLNVCDYIMEFAEVYLVAQHIFKIHEKLRTGIALVIVQRDPAKLYGSGGYAIRNIPRVIISLQDHIVKLEDVKSFRTNDGHNPSGLMRGYVMPGLTHFRPTTHWYRRGDAPRMITAIDPDDIPPDPEPDPDFPHEPEQGELLS